MALVEAYLRVNGYLTVAEYPVLDVRRRPMETVTDLDILAVRLDTIHDMDHEDGRPVVDAALGRLAGRTDMIVGEVKEGAPKLNRALHEPRVLQAALTRFGCCTTGEGEEIVARLLRDGEVITSAGHRIRIVAFGNPRGDSPSTRRWHTISLDQVVRYLQGHLRIHWDQIGHTQIKDPTLGLLTLLEKSARASRRT